MEATSRWPNGPLTEDIESIMSACSCSRHEAASILKVHEGNRDAAVKSLRHSGKITSRLSSTLPVAEPSLDPTRIQTGSQDNNLPRTSQQPPTLQSMKLNGPTKPPTSTTSIEMPTGEANRGEQDKFETDDDFSARLEEAMRVAFFSKQSSNQHDQLMENYIQDKATRFPNIFGQSSTALHDPFPGTVFEDLEKFTSGYMSQSKAWSDRLDHLMQQFENLPLQGRDREPIDSMAHSARNMRWDLESTQNNLDSVQTILGLFKDIVGGNNADDMINLVNQPPAVQAETVGALQEEMRKTIPALLGEDSEVMKSANQHKIGGMTSLRRLLNSTLNMCHPTDPASRGPRLPDLSTHEAFQYLTLRNQGSIRLLRLEDMSDDNPGLVQLWVEEVELNSSPAFNALSYVWGDHRSPIYQSYNKKRADWRISILCNGQRFLVTYNLFCCLRRLATAQDEPLRSLRRMPLWIDQLCINQSDEAEKNIQVAMMGKIYSSAQMVVSWLGEKDSDTDAAIGLVKALNDVPGTRIRGSDFDAAAFVSEFSQEDWIALGALLSRPYFKRVWIVPEVALARQLMMACGDRILDWDSLTRALQLLIDSRSWTELSQYVSVFRPPDEQISSFGMRSPLRFGEQVSILAEARAAVRSDKTPPINLMLLGRHFDATQVVDKFFAMVGMARDGMRTTNLQNFPAVDYGQSLKEAALNFAEYYLDHQGDLSLLALVEDTTHRTQDSRDFPSWLPDPAAPLLPLPLRAESIRLGSTTTWKVFGDLEAADKPQIKGHLLCLCGYKFDEVSKTAPSFNAMDRTDEWFQMFDFLASVSDVQTNGFSLGQALWRTLTTSNDRPGGKSVSTIDLDNEFGDWCISLVNSIRRHDMRKLTHSITPDIMISTHRLDDAISDIQIFGESLTEYLDGGRDLMMDMYGSGDLHYNVLDEKLGKGPRMSGKPGRDSQLEASLHRVWEANKDDIFPSPERIRNTMQTMHESHRETPVYTEVSESVSRFEAALGKKLHSRRLILTKNGCLGLGCESVAEGDEIWAVAGAQVPTLLQKTGQDTFRLVGEAFVFGAMHGEAVRDATMPPQSIVLE